VAEHNPNPSEIFDREADDCDQLLNKGDLEGALAALERAQAALPLDAATLVQKAKLAGLLVDVGGDTAREDLVQHGLTIYGDNYEKLAEILHPATVEYNLGNAKKVLYNLSSAGGPESFRVDAITLLTEAKNHYWRAIKHARGLGPPHPELLVNLANALDNSARLVEALLWYDLALSIDPGFGMALANRGLALSFVNSLSGGYSITLLGEIEKCFRLAEESGQLPGNILREVQTNRAYIAGVLREHGWDQESLAKEEEQHKAEYESHDEYWEFCLSNYLALSEHALYCRCAGARRDDLSIVPSFSPIGGDFILGLELLLNRIKSEFCLARSLFFQSLGEGDKFWDLHSFEGTFTELHEGEAIGLRAEFLRTSFRLCFGILDKIAQGLNELFGLAEKDEALYFESFWRPHKEKKQGKETRWEQLNRQRNMGLVALYSLATDLNRTRGEWGHFKAFRNELEHGLLILLEDDGKELPPLAMPSRISSETLSIGKFRVRTLQML
jgi:tetratricopeptide (TPR) repeat protein